MGFRASGFWALGFWALGISGFRVWGLGISGFRVNGLFRLPEERSRFCAFGTLGLGGPLAPSSGPLDQSLGP